VWIQDIGQISVTPTLNTQPELFLQQILKIELHQFVALLKTQHGEELIKTD
jgi:hypothetical protein